MEDPRVYLMEAFEEQTDEVQALIKVIGDSEDPDENTDRASARLAELGKGDREVAHLVNQYHISVGFYNHQ